MNHVQLPPKTQIGFAHLYTADMARALDFYSELMGFRMVSLEGGKAVLSANGKAPHILLTERKGALPKPANSTGLYHVAIRLPSRMELSKLLRRMIVLKRYPFTGFSDHAVSEAVYLNDPDGNGLELYQDRPREVWPRENGYIMMTTKALDMEGLLAEAEGLPWKGLHAKTDIGHVHLHVGSLEKAKAFYVDLIGLDVSLDWSGHGALFMSAGGYHHHLGVNVWAGTKPQPPNTLGLHSFQLTIPTKKAFKEIQKRLTSAGVAMETLDETRFLVQDPNQNAVEIAWIRRR